MREQIIDIALNCPELSPRELAVRFTDERGDYVFEVIFPRFSGHP